MSTKVKSAKTQVPKTVTTSTANVVTTTVPAATVKQVKKAKTVATVPVVPVVPVAATEPVAETTSDVTAETVVVVGGTVSAKKAASKRSFTVLKVTREGQEQSFKGGKFHSGTPAGAARKAANQACKTLFTDLDVCEIEIGIKEVTKNGTSKAYSYKATRKLAEKAVEFSGADSKIKIPFKYTMELKSLKCVGEKVVEETVNEDVTVA